MCQAVRTGTAEWNTTIINGDYLHLCLTGQCVHCKKGISQILQQYFKFCSAGASNILTASWAGGHRETQLDKAAHTVPPPLSPLWEKLYERTKVWHDQVSGSCLSNCLPSSPTNLGFIAFENLLVAGSVRDRREKDIYRKYKARSIRLSGVFGKHLPFTTCVMCQLSKNSETKTVLKCWNPRSVTSHPRTCQSQHLAAV